MRRDEIPWRLYQVAIISLAFLLLYIYSSPLAQDILQFGYRQWEALIVLAFFIFLGEISYTPAREGDFITVSFPFVLVSLIGLGFPTTLWLLWLVSFLTSIIGRRENILLALTQTSLKVVSLYLPFLLFQALGGKAEDVYSRIVFALLGGIAYYISDRVIVGLEVALKDRRLFKKNFWKSRWEESHMRYLFFVLGAMLISAGYDTPFQLPLFLLLGFFTSLEIYFIRAVELNRLNTRGIFEAFSEIAEGRWMGMVGHGKRVGMLVDEITKILDLPYEERERLILASILHDIGIVDTPYELLNYPTSEGEESEAFKRHAIRSAEILSQLPVVGVVADCVLYHHERPNGSGYPEGRKGEKVPFCAYIIGACCDFDDMTCYKSWRERIPPAQALRMMEESAGELYDKRAVALLREAAKRLRRY